jgi:selenocysteine-specific translation elongation factor
MSEVVIGTISEFFARPVVAGINLTGTMKIGDKIKVKGHTTDLDFLVSSIQIDNVNVQEAKAGDAVGIKVPDRVRKGDTVYRLTG